MSIRPSSAFGNPSTMTRRDPRILLVTPRTSALPYPLNKGVLGGALWPVPMGMAYVSSSLKAACGDVFNLNLDYEPGEVAEAVASAIKRHSINMVFTGGLAGQYSKIKAVVDAVKQVDRSITVVVGGRCITPVPIPAMEAFGDADIGILGEGEITSKELVEAFSKGHDLKDILGLIYRCDGEYLTTPPRDYMTDLDVLPFPDVVGLGCEHFFRSISTASVVAARSCPFHCTFCYGIAGKYRMRSIDNIIQEIASLIERYQVRTIAIIDELFVSNRSRILEFCEKIKPYKVAWGCTIHASACQDQALLKHLRDSGCCSLNLGVESGCDRVLKSMNKRATLREIEVALENIQSAHIGIIATCIFGDVAEDAASVEETLQWWRRHRQYPIELSRIYAYPGSEIYRYALESGAIQDEVRHLQEDCRECNCSQLTEIQYNDMSLRLTTEEAFYSYPPPDYSILEIDMVGQRTLARYRCSCGFSSEVWSAGLLLSSYIRCPECNQAYRMTFSEKYDLASARAEVAGLVEREGPLAFWGLGREMQLLLRGIDLTSLENVFVIDADAKKQGLMFLGKQVMAPDMLREGKVSTVVPSPLLLGGVHYMSTIEQDVRRLCSAKIVPFGDLLQLARPAL